MLDYARALIDDFDSSSRRRRVSQGDVLVEQGSAADEVFVVLTGRLEAVAGSAGDEVVIGSVGDGDVVGEVTVIAGGRRTATLRAAEPTEVLAIERARFESWLSEHPDAADVVSAQARNRIDRAQVAQMVGRLVGTGEPELVRTVVDRVGWRRLAAGDVLFEQGDPSDAAYFIVAGRVLVALRDGDGPATPVAELGRGEVVGELGLLDRAPRSATVRAVRDTTLAVFSTDVFEELVTRSPALMLHVARGILTRLRRVPRRTVGRAAALTIAVTAPVDPTPIVDGVTAAIARFGSVRLLTSSRVDQILNCPGIAQAGADSVGVPRLAEFMHEADVGNDHVVLVADREPGGWTRRALHQADRVVIVCSPQPGDDERRHIAALLDELRDVDHVAVMLAVLHPAAAERPRDTAALVRSIDPTEHRIADVVHLRADDTEGIARLGRLASGNGVGVVLSGGGARGFAHLGVHRALREAGVPVDAIAGCSIGAPLGAVIATEVEGTPLIELVQRQFHRLLDYTLPVVSLVKGRRISTSIEDVLGEWDIEDLWLPYYCVSTNLTRSRLEVHRRGDLARAVRASVAIPGVLPPVPMDGDLLVDGGVLNNLPFEPMRQDGRIDTIIAIDVAPARGPRAGSDFGLSVSGARALVASARGAKEYPSLTSVLLRSMLAGSVYNQRQALRSDAVDLFVRLELPGVALLDFERVAEVADKGYEAAVDEVRAWAVTRPWAVTAS